MTSADSLPRGLSTCIKWVDRLIAGSLLLIFALLVVVVVAQVTSRYLTDSPTTATDEMARFLLIWLGLLGAAYASGAMRHLSIDLLPQLLPPASRRYLLMALQALVLFFALYAMILGGGELVRSTLARGETTPMLGVAMGWIYSVLPLSGTFIAFYAVVDLYRLARRLPDSREAVS